MENESVTWDKMTPEQKRDFRLEQYRKSGENIEFINDNAKKAYQVRVQRLIDVYNVQKPDRVPTSIMTGNLPLTMAGMDMYSAFYEPKKANAAAMKFNEEYSEKLESFSLAMAMSGEALDILDYKLYAWPGHILPKSSGGWQYIEGEYMTADEYDDLIRDPSDFWLRKYLPRVFGSFDGFRYFQPFTNITENIHVAGLMPLAMPPVREMLRKLLDAGEAFERNSAEMFHSMTMGGAWGFPPTFGEFCKPPFDTLGDTLRGTTNIMKDMFQRPEKLLKALDVIADISINNVLTSPTVGNAWMVNYPLHKGADGWMSQAQYEKFYWPSFKKVMDALIKEGLIQHLFAEGSYNTRLNYVNQFPRGSVVWWFDRTDMVEAKKILGKDCAIMGNVPSSLLVMGEPEKVKEYCRNLIETVGRDGGYILGPGTVPEYPKLENLIAMVDAANEYGYY